MFFTVLRNTAAPLVLLVGQYCLLVGFQEQALSENSYLQVLCSSRSNCTCQTSFLHSLSPQNFAVQFTPVLNWMT